MHTLTKSLVICLSCISLAVAEPLQVTRGKDITVSWERPTTRVDGSDFNDNEVKNYTLFFLCDTGKLGSYITVDASESMPVSTSSMLGQCSIYIKVTDVNGIGSELSEPVLIIVKLPNPRRGGIRWRR